jgi:hypothetical protein
MRLLFLDIDGVLNNHDYCKSRLSTTVHRDKVHLLNSVLEVTGARIVLSSAWRYLVHRGEMKLMGLEWLLRSHGVLADRLVGITEPDEMIRNRHYDGVPQNWPPEDARGQQIADYLASHPYSSYAVVDDLDLGISALHEPFVQTDGMIGLTVADAMKLTWLLRSIRART